MGVSIVVLAAGASQRMGKPKPLLDFDGETCLSLVLGACWRSRAEETVLVLGTDADAIRSAMPPARIASGGLKVVLNDHPERGQTSSLKTGLEAVSGRADGFVLFPVDHPLVTSGDLDALITRFEARPRGRTIFISSHENLRGHPVLFAAVHRAPILELGDAEPLHNYIRVREGEIEQVGVGNPGVVTGINTPEEYQRALTIFRNRPDGARRPGRPEGVP